MIQTVAFLTNVFPLSRPSPFIRINHRTVPKRHVSRNTATMRAFWVQPLSKPALTTSLESNINQILFPSVEEHAPYSNIAQYDPTILSPDGTFPHGIHQTITSSTDVTHLTQLAGIHEIVIMDCKDWSSIPAENLLAAYQHSPSKLYAIVDDTPSAEAMFGMLEIGVDGCVLRTDKPDEVLRFAELRRKLDDSNNIDFTTAEVVSIRPVGSGERVCIDTCSLLREDEGLLVGTSSQALFHVLSESAQTSYVASRPFRINAGPVHSYCLLPGGKTCYLCELSAGDEVLIVAPDGKTRAAVVGRSKIETRPLLLLSAKTESGDVKTVFLQNAETVRLGMSDGMTSVTNLRPGDKVSLRTDDVARHTGIAIKEKLLEK